LWTPFALTILTPSRKRREVLTRAELDQDTADSEVLVLHDHSTGAANIYRPLRQSGQGAATSYARVMSQRASGSGVSFEYDPADVIRKSGDYYEVQRDRHVYRFGVGGRLVEVLLAGRRVAHYSWRNDTLTRIEDASGHWYSMTPDPSDKTRIGTVQTSDG